MNRSISATARASLERPSSPDALIWYLQIDHPTLKDPIRVVADVFDHRIDGVLWQKAMFSTQPLTDSDQMPYTEIRVPNTSRILGAALERAVEPAKVFGFIHTMADFDLTKDPREPLGTPERLYEFRHMNLVDVDVGPAEITGRLRLEDYSTEPWPALRATEDRFPGLFF